MRVLLHCDGGPGVGVGHTVRSLALAEEALSRGHEVTIAGWVGGDFLEGLVAEREQTGLVRHPLEAGAGAAELAGLVDELAPHVVHLDSYRTPDVAGTLVERHPGVLVSNAQDGGYGRRHADVVIDSTLGAEEMADVPGTVRWRLLGASCAPLRHEVLRHRHRPGHTPGDALEVLVVMGGTDATGAAPYALDVLGRCGVAARVTVIATAPLADEVASVARQHPQLSVEVVGPVRDLPALMARQDLVLSASGTSTWELCAMAVPMGLICVVDNQLAGYRRLVDRGAAVGLGGPDLSGPQRDLAVDALAPALLDAGLRASLARTAATVVDGHGAWRLVRTWEVASGSRPRRAAPALTASRAVMEDARTLWRWRNDPETRSRSRSQKPVAWDDHVRWLTGSLDRADRLLLVVSDEAGQVGTVRWDLEGDGEWEVSITVAPERRGAGLAVPMLEAAQSALLDTHGVRRFRAAIHIDNTASRRLFVTAGYVPHQPPDEAGFETYVLLP